MARWDCCLSASLSKRIGGLADPVVNEAITRLAHPVVLVVRDGLPRPLAPAPAGRPAAPPTAAGRSPGGNPDHRGQQPQRAPGRACRRRAPAARPVSPGQPTDGPDHQVDHVVGDGQRLGAGQVPRSSRRVRRRTSAAPSGAGAARKRSAKNGLPAVLRSDQLRQRTHALGRTAQGSRHTGPMASAGPAAAASSVSTGGPGFARAPRSAVATGRPDALSSLRHTASTSRWWASVRRPGARPRRAKRASAHCRSSRNRTSGRSPAASACSSACKVRRKRFSVATGHQPAARRRLASSRRSSGIRSLTTPALGAQRFDQARPPALDELPWLAQHDPAGRRRTGLGQGGMRQVALQRVRLAGDEQRPRLGAPPLSAWTSRDLPIPAGPRERPAARPPRPAHAPRAAVSASSSAVASMQAGGRQQALGDVAAGRARRGGWCGRCATAAAPRAGRPAAPRRSGSAARASSPAAAARCPTAAWGTAGFALAGGTGVRARWACTSSAGSSVWNGGPPVSIS